MSKYHYLTEVFNNELGVNYNLVFHNLFCESYDDYVMKTTTDLWGESLDCKRFLSDYFNIPL